MRTSSNVMGIQAKLMLERIAATLDAVQAGHQQKPAYLLADRPIHMDKPEPDEGERELEVVFATRDVVYLDERLTREIPEPNWSKAAPAGCVIPDGAGVARIGTHDRHSGAAGSEVAGRQAPQAELHQEAAARWAVPFIGEVLVQAYAGDMGNTPQDIRSAPSPPASEPLTLC